MNDWIKAIFTGIITLFIGIYIERYRNKFTILKYRTTLQPLATSSKNDTWGNIEVMYDNRKVNHLTFVSFEVYNNSNKDLEDVIIYIKVDDADSSMLRRNGIDMSTSKSIPYSAEYKEFYDGVNADFIEHDKKRQSDPEHVMSDKLQKDLGILFKNVEFIIPILNRDNYVVFDILVEKNNFNRPNLSINTHNKSVKILPEKNTQARDKFIGKILIACQIILSIILFSLCYFIINDSMYSILILGLFNILYYPIAILVLKLIGYVKSFF